MTLAWSFEEVNQLNIDLASILDGLDLDEDIVEFAKGILAFDGQALTTIEGNLSLTLGLGLEYDKQKKDKNIYIKGNTGLEVGFSAEVNLEFDATIGPLPAFVEVLATIDNLGELLQIKFGLDERKNYYLSPDRTLARTGYEVVSSVSKLVDSISPSVAGGFVANINAKFGGGLGSASLIISASDLNGKSWAILIERNNSSLFLTFCHRINIMSYLIALAAKKQEGLSIIYTASVVETPSLLTILLMDPAAIVDAVDDVFKAANDLSFGRTGIVTRFNLPFVGGAVSRALKAGSSDNFLERARRLVVGTMSEVIDTYDDEESTGTVADLVADILSDLLDDVLRGNINVTYYEHVGNATVGSDVYDESKTIKSLMW